MPLLQGWDEGVAGMKVGGERVLIIPPSLGYGKRKMDGIPPSSTLRFGEPIGCPLLYLLELTVSCQRSSSST
jgi:FKBP-type peptidyl-prolyl cis-trans isomerase 2